MIEYKTYYIIYNVSINNIEKYISKQSECINKFVFFITHIYK